MYTAQAVGVRSYAIKLNGVIMGQSVRLHPSVRVVRLEGNRVGFLGMPDAVHVKDPEGVLYQNFSDARVDVDLAAILSSITSEQSKEEVIEILQFLTKYNLLIPSQDADQTVFDVVTDGYAAQLDLISRNVRAHYRGFGLGVGYGARKVMKVVAVGSGLVADEFVKACRPLVPSIEQKRNITELDSVERGATILVGCYDQDCLMQMLELNDAALRLDMAATYAVADGYRVRIGPLVIPGASGCLRCLEKRVRINSEIPDGRTALFTQSAGSLDRTQSSVILAKLAGSLVANQAVKVALGLRHLVNASEVWEFDLIGDVFEKCAVARDPRCPVCGRAGQSVTAEAQTRYVTRF
jgi:bacteriocin biosynthesis cyclodehydratase domain-containing protein